MPKNWPNLPPFPKGFERGSISSGIIIYTVCEVIPDRDCMSGNRRTITGQQGLVFTIQPPLYLQAEEITKY